MSYTDHVDLTDRRLWCDGDSTVTDYNLLYNKILCNQNISQFFVEDITPEVKMFNGHASAPLRVKESVRSLDTSWNIPEKFKTLNVRTHVLHKLDNEFIVNNFTENEMEQRINRTLEELDFWESFNMVNLLRTLIYIVDIFNKNNTVWGTGRGSSCACYTLYLIGLHDVDSVLYELDIKEFFRK